MSCLYCEDSRRLTGANLYTSLPGAVLDLTLKNESGDNTQLDLASIIDCWEQHVDALLKAVSWDAESTFQRRYEGGVSLGISAPIDGLYAAVEVIESALILSSKEQGLGEVIGVEIEIEADFEKLVEYLKDVIKEETNPALIKLQSSASDQNVLFLYDDDLVSLGTGQTCQQWPVEQIPEQFSWNEFSSIPLALITGTNGKSTSVRLASSITKAAGLTTGSTSTDFIKVGNSIIDEGDYSGPGDARTLVRDERVEIAFLEVARGGLLRRGLGVPQVDAALITNVAADHLGEYGINSIPELIECKFIVQKALKPFSPLVLNADDEGVVKFSSKLDQVIIWFAESTDNVVLSAHVEAGGEAVSIKNNQIVHIKNGDITSITEITEVPITLQGMARYNVQNTLGVTALACALGINHQYIKQGLINFKGDADENPGRGNFFEGNGIKILIDFAHNEHGMTALTTTASNIESERLLVLMGQAGDRSNEAIADLTKAALSARPNQMVVSETPGYERGREENEISDIIVEAIIATGFPETNITRTMNPIEGVRKALDWAKPGDFLLLFVLTNRNEVIEIVKDFVRE